ncbi:unnamed protein product [Mycena citricolor]|uniref:Uncharacterized protein n=1 Tax=Mycena citricolor TaxID=2018698 RepID=A0AAD2Q4G9_9AGAR|nr:unnamed protein product [Mycena citricolor]
MSFPTFRRQSRVTRRNTINNLTSIIEEDEFGVISTAAAPKKNSLKARRRLGVSDLRIPASLASPEKKRFSLPPRARVPLFAQCPTSDSDDEEDYGTPCVSGSSSDSSSPSTPSHSPTSASFPAPPLSLKSIRPLTIVKRPVSPICFAEGEEEQQEAGWQDEEETESDNEYYAQHASGLVTLRPEAAYILLPRRESMIIPMPNRLSLNLPSSMGGFVPRNRSASEKSEVDVPVPNFSRPNLRVSLVRPPPRSPVPMDAGDCADEYVVYTPSPSPSSSSSTSSSSLAALLSPSGFPPESQGLPSDVDANDDEWEECDIEVMYDEIPLSPQAGSSEPASPHISTVIQQEKSTPPPIPPKSAHVELLTRSTTPQLKSRWSSSTLSSINSAQDAPSPKTFNSFASRYFPSSTSSHSSSKKSAHQSPKSPLSVSFSPKNLKRKTAKRRITAADVVIVRPATSGSLMAAVSSTATATATSPVSPNGQWASYPTSPKLPPVIRPAPTKEYKEFKDVPLSPALVTAYTTQRSPRRRTSNASAWSFGHPRSASSSGCSSSGMSDCGSEITSSSTSSSGLRRKPIPVEMFLR